MFEEFFDQQIPSRKEHAAAVSHSDERPLTFSQQRFSDIPKPSLTCASVRNLKVQPKLLVTQIQHDGTSLREENAKKKDEAQVHQHTCTETHTERSYCVFLVLGLDASRTA